ncbi:MAG: DUF2282 domain-containing protein [Gammaproteobacteria bacterium]|nr:DUF2282 domain-containing protein [Gammaproteobacteria bacterium]
MQKVPFIASTAISSLLVLGALGLANGTATAGESGKVKCYGVAQAGHNDCAANGHACQGQARADNDPAEWKYASKEECDAQGGSTSPGQRAQ